MIVVDTVRELEDLVRSETHVRVAGGGTKSATSHGANVSVGRLSGIIQYDPGEFTFTAFAGTRVADIEALLLEQNQYLPFDAPLVAAGATLGGTVATGMSGSGRYRYGGVRDFLLGAKVITGRGVTVTTGSKVVKNAAGFDFPKLMVGSLGRYGLMTELTFKVFPKAQTSATVVFHASDLAESIDLLCLLRRSQLDFACLDLDADHRVFARLSGFATAVKKRIERVQKVTSAASSVMVGEAEAALWNDAREFQWLPENEDLVKVPVTPRQISVLLSGLGSVSHRFAVGGDIAWIGWPHERDVAELDRVLRETKCRGVFVTGVRESPFINNTDNCAFGARLQVALDPDHKFVFSAPATV